MTITRIRQKTPLLQLIEQLRAFILTAQTANNGNADGIASIKQLAKELRQEREHMQTMLLTALDDRPVPIAMYEPWTIYRTINKAELAGALTQERRNGKLLLTPTAFFKWFNSLPMDRQKARTH